MGDGGERDPRTFHALNQRAMSYPQNDICPRKMNESGGSGSGVSTLCEDGVSYRGVVA
jgi:hypothetical protein